jgi:hypothetical protein
MKRKVSMPLENSLSLRFLVIGFLVVTFVTACGGKKEVKQVSQDSKVSQEAFSLAETIRTAYVKKEFATISDRCTKEGYKDIIDSVKYFDSVDLSFTPRWVEIDKTMVTLNIAWKGSWVVGKDTVRERGMAVFLLEGTPLKLTKILKGNPFKYPETRP